LYSDKPDVAALVARDALQKRITFQILANGEMPAELARTKSWSYSEFCSDAMMQLTALASISGVDLTHQSGVGDSRLRLALDFQLPYVTGQATWNWTQIVPFTPPNCTITAVDQCIGSYFSVYRRAANMYNSKTYEKAILKLQGVDANASVINLVIPQHIEI
jgi:hypothetical protein